MQPRSARAILVALALSATLVGCRAGRVPRGELVFLIEAPPTTLDPRFAVSAYDFKLSRLVYAPLVSVDNERVAPQMELAESVVAESATSYLVTLRAGAQFSDGNPVTADDVAWTIASIRDPDTRSRLAMRYREDGLVRVDVLDGRRLRFTLAHPHAPFVTDLDVGILERPARGHEAGAPVGAGPFVLASSAGDRWTLVPNAHFYNGAPTVEELVFKVIRDDNSRLLALVGGSGDLTQNSVSLLLLDAIAREPRLRVETARSSVLTYLGVNCGDPILRDVRVRQALALAIDRRTIVATTLRGHAVLATGMLPTFHWAYAGEVDKWEYDPARARALLDEAGYPVGQDGKRFTLVYKTSSNRFRVALAQILAAQLGAVGVDVDLRPLEFATFFADVKAGNYQIFSMQIPEIAEPDLYTNFFHSSRIPTREAPDRGGNRMRYASPLVDKLLDAGRVETDRARGIAIYAELQRVLARELPIVPLWHEDNVVVMGASVTGFSLLPTGQLAALARTHK